MKQCSICGYLFQPDESQPLRCPRCGMPFQKYPSPETDPETSQDQPVSEDFPQEPELKQEDIPVPASQEDRPSQPQPQEEAAQPESAGQEEDFSDEKETPEPAAESPTQDSSVPPDAPPSLLPEKKRKWPKVLGLLLLLLLVAVVSFFLGLGQRDSFSQEEEVSSSTQQVQPSTGVYYDPQGASPEEFARLQTGMTYAQISAIIGGDAYQTTVPDVSGSYSAAWQGQDNPEAVLTVRFVNGQAVDLQQSGLTEETSSTDSESATQE